MQAELVGISLSWSPGKAFYIPVKGPLGAFRVFDDVEILYSFVVRRPADPS